MAFLINFKDEDDPELAAVLPSKVHSTLSRVWRWGRQVGERGLDGRLRGGGLKYELGGVQRQICSCL